MNDKSPASNSTYYSASAVRKSLLHFLLGKSVSAISTLLVLLFIVREFSIAEFGAYTSLHALVLIIGLISSLGVPQVLHRYLPELRTHGNNRAMYRLLVSGITLRACLYALFCMLVLAIIGLVTSTFKLDDWYAIVPGYLLVGFLRVNATFIAQALESLLWQRDAQYSLALGGLTKLLATSYCAVTEQLTLVNFVQVEIFSELAALILLLAFVLRRWMTDKERAVGDTAVLRKDGRRYLRFGFWCYMQNATSIFSGSAPNRLFVAYFLSAEYIAIFGLVDRLIDFVRRYEPLHLFVGMIRPVLMSRFSQNMDFQQLVRLGNLVLLANYVLLFAPLVVLLVSGDVVLDWLTEGKYVDIAWLTAAFYIVVLVHSVSALLDMLVKAVEHNRVYLFSNLFLSGSLLLAVPLIPSLGLWSIAAANLTGLLLAMTIIIRYIGARSFNYQFEWRHGGIVALIAGLATVFGFALTWAGLPNLFAGCLALLAYIVLIYLRLPLRPEEKATMLEILPLPVRNVLQPRAQS